MLSNTDKDNGLGLLAMLGLTIAPTLRQWAGPVNAICVYLFARTLIRNTLRDVKIPFDEGDGKWEG